MRVFLAGATGAIGRPLLPALLAAGHDVTALSRDETKAARLRELGAEAAIADAFDAEAVREAVVGARPEVVIHQLTALPNEMDLRDYAGYLAPTNRLRRETTPHFLAAAREAGARRVIFQSVSFLVAPEGPPDVDESARLFTEAPKQLQDGVASLVEMERMVLEAEALEGLALRYGFFYGPGTYYARDGSLIETVRKRQFPLLGGGAGRSSFIHVDDAAAATVLALDHGSPGIYNVVDDHPAPASEWLPFLAETIGAKPPRRLPLFVGRMMIGPHVAHMSKTLRGNRNDKARRELGFEPRYPSYRKGFPAALGQTREPVGV